MTLNESLGGGITGSADGCLKAFQMDEVNVGAHVIPLLT